MPTMEEVRAKKEARKREKEAAAKAPQETPAAAPAEEPAPQEPEAPKETLADLKKLTKKVLQERATALGLKFTSSTPKGDLAKIVLKGLETQTTLPVDEQSEPPVEEPPAEQPKPDEGKTPAKDDLDKGITPAPDDGKIKLAGMEVVSVKETIDYLNCMIHGDPGVGKTYLAGTAALVPEMSPVLLIDIEGGSKTLRTFDNIDVVRVVDITRIKPNGESVVVKHAWEVLYGIYEQMTADTHYKTVIIDSASEAYEVLSAFVLTKEYIRAQENDRDKHEEVMEMRDWGIARNMFKKFVKAWNDLPKNVIFTALPGEVKDQKSGGIKVGPMFPGKLFKEVPAKMNEVYYLYTKSEKDGVERKLLTQPEGKYYAKTRSMGAPLVLTNPTMEAIFKFAVDPQASNEQEATGTDG